MSISNYSLNIVWVMDDERKSDDKSEQHGHLGKIYNSWTVWYYKSIIKFSFTSDCGFQYQNCNRRSFFSAGSNVR